MLSLPCALLSDSVDPSSHPLVGTTPESIVQQKDMVIRVQNGGKKAFGGDRVISYSLCKQSNLQNMFNFAIRIRQDT